MLSITILNKFCEAIAFPQSYPVSLSVIIATNGKISMEISVTESRIVLKNKDSTSAYGCLLVLALFLLIFPLAGILLIFYALGDTDLTCQRISANLVNCKKTHSNFLGLPNTSIYFTKITGAEFDAKEEQDDDGNRSTMTIQLVDDLQIKQEFFAETHFDYDPSSKMVDITRDINSFIKSNTPTFFLHLELHLSFEQIYFKVIQPLLFCSLFLFCGGKLLSFSVSAISYSKTWDFNKISGLLIYEIRSSKGTRTTSESLKNFQEIQIIENKRINIESDNDDLFPVYELKLLHKSVDTSYIFTSITTRSTPITFTLSEIEDIALKLSDFLQIPINRVVTVTNSNSLDAG